MMSEETIIVEVEPESISPQPVDVKVTSIVLDEEIPGNVNIPAQDEKGKQKDEEGKDIMVQETTVSAKDEEGKQKDIKESLLWDEKTVGSNELDNPRVRRNSTSLLFGSNKKVNVTSRYLGGSPGSCHDLCKFGHKNTSETKSNHHVMKTPLLTTLSEGKDLLEIECSAYNRKKSVIRRLSFPAAKAENHSQMHAMEMKHSGKPMVEPKENPTIVESPTKISGEVKTLKEQSISYRKPLESSSHKVREVKVTKGENKPIGLVSETLPSKPPMNKVVSMNGRIHRDLSRLSHLKNHQDDNRQESKAKLPEDVPEKILYMNEPNGKSTAVDTSQKAPLDSNKLLKTQGGSHAGTRKGSARQNGTHNSRLTASFLPSPHKPSKSQKEKLEEKESAIKHSDTFFGDSKSKSSTGNSKPCPPKSKPEASKAKQSKTKQNGIRNSHLTKSLLPAIDKPCKSQEEELGETQSVCSKHSDTMSADSKSKPSRPKTKPSTPKSKPGTPKGKQSVEPKAKVARAGKSQIGEEGSNVTRKMEFRRGKVIALPSGNNSPRKLKFKKPRGLSDNQHVEINARKVNHKSNEVEVKEPQKDAAESAKVVLRRQEATCKKDDVDLNNVIEETASKLVKTRKSKVKALVGAFETVMSLRNHKASETTVAS